MHLAFQVSAGPSRTTAAALSLQASRRRASEQTAHVVGGPPPPSAVGLTGGGAVTGRLRWGRRCLCVLRRAALGEGADSSCAALVCCPDAVPLVAGSWDVSEPPWWNGAFLTVGLRRAGRWMLSGRGSQKADPVPSLSARLRWCWARGRHLQADGSCLLTSATPMLSPVQTAPDSGGSDSGWRSFGVSGEVRKAGRTSC